MNLDRIINPLLLGIAPHQSMRAHERALGFEIVLPGEASWLRREDWDDSVVVSKDRRRVRLVALKAHHPGNGALRRTVAGIVECGLEPVIVEPHPRLEQSLKRWGWKRRSVGHGDDAHIIWHRK
jgi:hypothetical protein